jgi:hypothetical protein
MTLSIIADDCYAEYHLYRVSVMLSVENQVFYAECHYVECRYAECHYAESHGDLILTLPTARLTYQHIFAYSFHS